MIDVYDRRMADIIFFKDGEKRIPFSQFLRQVKNDLVCSWNELSECCGVEKMNTYANKNTNGNPNNPPRKKFLKIIKTLGFNEDKFEITGGLRERQHLSTEGYNLAIKEIADYVLKLNSEKENNEREQRISTSLIREHISENFYQKYGKSIEDRQKILRDIHALGPKYQRIKLSKQVQNRSKVQLLEVWEEKVIKDYLLQVGVKKEDDKKPYGTHKKISELINHERRRKGLRERTTSSLSYHTKKILSGTTKNRYTFLQGSPASIEDKIAEVINEEATELDENSELEEIVDPDENKMSREEYLKVASYGHQMLLAYLMVPENYKAHFHKDAELISADFTQTNWNGVKQELVDKHKKRFDELFERFIEYKDSLEDIANDDKELADFTDGWLRCDLVYKVPEIGYILVEVKQNAVNTDDYNNADKAAEQIDTYTAGILGKIIRKNMKNENEDERLVEKVEGCVAAFTIDDNLKEYIESQENKSLIEFNRDDVENYIRRMLGYEISDNSENDNEVILDPEPNDVNAAKKHQEYKLKKENFLKLSALMKEVPADSADWAMPTAVLLKYNCNGNGDNDDNECICNNLLIVRNNGEELVFEFNGIGEHYALLDQWIDAKKVAIEKRNKHKKYDNKIAV